MLQPVLVALIVAACAAYVVWALLLPAVARRQIARMLLRWPLPAALAAWLRRQSQAQSGCACDGCDKAGVPAIQAATQAVRWVARRRP